MKYITRYINKSILQIYIYEFIYTETTNEVAMKVQFLVTKRISNLSLAPLLFIKKSYVQH